MKFLHLLWLFSSFLLCSSDSTDWSWGASGKQGSDQVQNGENTTVIEPSIQGRNLRGFDLIENDPGVQEIIQNGNESQARHYIKDRLCSLGLMSECDGIEPKRSYIQPHEVIYAQPVAIKPVGHPLPAVPVHGPPRPPHYGLPKPPGPPGHLGPPIHYRPPKPLPPPLIPGSSYGVAKPVLPPVYERPEFDQPFLGKGPVGGVIHSPNGVGVQQHVHHHYHHGQSGGLEQKPINVGPHPIYEPSYDDSPYINPLDGPTSFYKKEISVKPQLSANGISSQGDHYQAFETGRAEGYQNCVCVPYDQCPSLEVGRKEDGLLIDPRNLGSNIEAITLDDVVANLDNSSRTESLTKREDSNKQEDPLAEASNRSKRAVSSENEKNVKPVEEDNVSDGTNNEEQKSEINARLFFNSDKEGIDLKVKPTFGVSFGLPGGGGGGYPLNPFGSYPYPYGSSVGPGGINLGPVSVNPLIALQVTKDDYGEKVLKPLVNFHVTPNPGLVHKIGGIIHNKFLYHPLLNKHHHHHQHVHTHPPIPPPYPPYYDHHPPRPGYGLYAQDYPDFRASEEYDDAHPANKYSNQNEYIPPNREYVNDYDDIAEQNDYYEAKGSSGNKEQRGRDGKSLESSPSSSSPESNTKVHFPRDRRSFTITTHLRTRRETSLNDNEVIHLVERQAGFGGNRCGFQQVCCRRPLQPQRPQFEQCGRRHAHGINGRIKTPVYVDGDSEFGEYPWQVAILKKDTQESVYVCGGTLVDNQHILTAAHCVKAYTAQDLRVRLGEWDVNHDVEFYPYTERDVVQVIIHPEFYAGTLQNDIAILRLARAVDLHNSPHISPACLPDRKADFSGQRCWTTGWGKDAFGDYGKYQNILKEVDVPVVPFHQCQSQLQQTRLGHTFRLHPGMLCAGGEEGKDACKGDGGGPMVCERGGTWHVVGIVSWGIGCGQYGVPGVYVNVAHYTDWIHQITRRF